MASLDKYLKKQQCENIKVKGGDNSSPLDINVEPIYYGTITAFGTTKPEPSDECKNKMITKI